MWIFFVIILGALGYYLFRTGKIGGGAGPGPGSSETALDILKKRYARGEISKEEFEQLRKDIE